MLKNNLLLMSQISSVDTNSRKLSLINLLDSIKIELDVDEPLEDVSKFFKESKFHDFQHSIVSSWIIEEKHLNKKGQIKLDIYDPDNELIAETIQELDTSESNSSRLNIRGQANGIPYTRPGEYCLKAKLIIGKESADADFYYKVRVFHQGKVLKSSAS